MTKEHNSQRVNNKNLLLTQKRLGITYERMAKILNISPRTLTDWKREKFLMSLDAYLLLEKKALVRCNNLEVKDPFWYTSKGGKIAGKLVHKKYGWSHIDQEHRKKKWREWWEKEGRETASERMKDTDFVQRHKIKEPQHSVKLAEFVGIILGDGGLNTFQLTVTLNRIDDRLYVDFVKNLIIELFDVPVGKHIDKNSKALSLVVSRVALVDYCVDKLDLKRGNKVKQQVDIPAWIKQNERYSIACVRGLFDTDGSVFTHSYIVGNKRYSYKKLAYTSVSKSLMESVDQIISMQGIKTRIARGRDVRIDGKNDIAKYFEIFGTSNQKHLNRYRN